MTKYNKETSLNIKLRSSILSKPIVPRNLFYTFFPSISYSPISFATLQEISYRSHGCVCVCVRACVRAFVCLFVFDTVLTVCPIPPWNSAVGGLKYRAVLNWFSVTTRPFVRVSIDALWVPWKINNLFIRLRYLKLIAEVCDKRMMSSLIKP
jgi:hypothetical protein